MAEIRVSYNPFTGQFLTGGLSHAEDIRRAGHDAQGFDNFIRGIIADGVLYLRLFWPFPGLERMTRAELDHKSGELLRTYEGQLLAQIKAAGLGGDVSTVKYNVDNDLLRGCGLANI